jgi:hypothetical protein
MSHVLAYKYEDALTPGCAVVVGEVSGQVALPGASGAGIFAGIFGYEGNCEKGRPNSNDTVGITIFGPCKVKVSGSVCAFDFGQLADDAGSLKQLEDPPDPLPLKVPGFFMEDGLDGEIVDFFVNPFTIPSAAAEIDVAMNEHTAAVDPHEQYEKEADLAIALALKADLVDGKVPAEQLPA